MRSSRESVPKRLVQPVAGLVWLCAVLGAWGAVAQSGPPTPTRISTDGTLPGQTPVDVDGVADPGGSGEVYEIGESLGSRAGQNLFHSFQFFDVGEGDTARFTADAPVENLISRVTGGDPSRIDGRIESTVGEQNFFFLNPNGVLFGPQAELDVPGSFHVSTADELRFADPGEVYSASSPAGGTLAVSQPQSFGFLSGEIGEITVAPRAGPGRLEVSRGETISLVGGDITIDGGLVSALQGDVRLIAVASPGEIQGITGATDEITLDGFSELGDVALLDGAIVNSGALSPVFVPVAGNPGPPGQLSGPFIDADGAVSTLANPAVVIGDNRQLGDVTLSDGAVIDLVLRPNPRPDDGAGEVAVLARNLTIRDAEIRALNPGDQSGGGITVDLTGDLEIVRDVAAEGVGLRAETGVTIRGNQTFLDPQGMQQTVTVDLVVAGSGPGGDIEVDARNVRIEGGGVISTTSFSAGDSGSVDIRVQEGLQLSGQSADGLTPSSIFSSTQGAGDGGEVRIAGLDLRLADGAAIISQTTTDGDAGDVSVAVERLEIDGRSQIDSSTSAQSLDRPVLYVGNAGTAGDITVRADESIRIVGDGASRSGEFANIRSSSQARSVGDAGRLRIETPLLQLDRTGGIEVVTRGAGDGGEIVLDAGDIRLDGASYVSGRSFAAAGAPELSGLDAGDAGNIVVGPEDAVFPTVDLRLDGASEIVTSAVAAEGGNITITASGLVRLDDRSGIDASDTGGEGGNVLIPPFDSPTQPEVVLVTGASRILARAAVAGGDGGVIRIAADNVLVSPDSVIDAENEVVINSPDTTLESGLVRPASSFLDATSLVRPTCAARAGGRAAGSFSVARGRSRPIAPGELLLAYDRLGPAATPDAPRAIELVAGTRGRIDGLLRQGQAEQSEGEFSESFETLRSALVEAEAAGDRGRVAASLANLANTYLAIGDLDEAFRLLEEATEQAQDAGDDRLRGTLLHDRGNLALRSRRYIRALESFDESGAIAGELGDRDLAAKALSNAARAAIALGDDAQAADRLSAAERAVAELAPGRSRVRVRIHLARSFGLQAREDLGARGAALLRAHALLAAAAEEAAALSDPYLESYALGHLGELYLEERRSREALYLTRQALARGEQAGSLDALSRWSWQEGRLLWDAGRVDPALDSMERAVGHLEDARQSIILQQGAVGSADFRSSVAPIYLDLTQRLLEASELAASAPDRDALLRRARSVVELFKAAELRDYFRDQCVADLEARTINPEAVARGAAVVYPIALPDRLELLVTLPSGIRRYTVEVPERELVRDVVDFRTEVAGLTNRYRRSGERLHRALVAPYADALEEEGVETIVLVPDGMLRTLPFGALWDGERFLVERFSLAVTPVLEVVDPRPLERGDLRPLLVGVSQAVDDFSALPAVPAELDSVKARVGGRVLLDEAFGIDRFEREIEARRPDIIHIASHAQFRADPSESFLLAYDGRLSLDRFGEIMRGSRFAEDPVELLVLSACETATGNDRSALGLAGVAIRSGVRSAIGSLWQVNDERTAQLFEYFYEAIGKPGVSRAEALRTAQLRMIEAGPMSRHPRDWAAFLLISSWL